MPREARYRRSDTRLLAEAARAQLAAGVPADQVRPDFADLASRADGPKFHQPRSRERRLRRTWTLCGPGILARLAAEHATIPINERTLPMQPPDIRRFWKPLLEQRDELNRDQIARALRDLARLQQQR